MFSEQKIKVECPWCEKSGIIVREYEGALVWYCKDCNASGTFDLVLTGNGEMNKLKNEKGD